MSSFSKLYTSLENDIDSISEAEITIDDVIEAQETTEDVLNKEQEVKELQNTISTGIKEIDTLEAVANQLENSIPGGGVEPLSARIAEMAVESIYNRLGINKRAMPSLEDFNSTSSRIAATKLAVENIRETVQKAWKAICEFFKKLYNSIVNFIKSTLQKLGFIDSYEKKAKKAKETLSTIDETYLRNPPPKFSELVESFELDKYIRSVLNKKYNTAKDLENCIKQMHRVLTLSVFDSKVEQTKLADSIEKGIKFMKWEKDDSPFTEASDYLGLNDSLFETIDNKLIFKDIYWTTQGMGLILTNDKRSLEFKYIEVFEEYGHTNLEDTVRKFLDIGKVITSNDFINTIKNIRKEIKNKQEEIAKVATDGFYDEKTITTGLVSKYKGYDELDDVGKSDVVRYARMMFGAISQLRSTFIQVILFFTRKLSTSFISYLNKLEEIKNKKGLFGPDIE